MTGKNLIPFFVTLPIEEQQKFMKLAAKVIVTAKVILPKKQKAILTGEEAIQYLITKNFKRLV